MFGLDIQGIETELFQSYQSKQINPDARFKKHDTTLHRRVSIVSIQTDQSRLQKTSKSGSFGKGVSIVSIQTDQSRQDDGTYSAVIGNMWFQSYQSKQINPDYGSSCW